MPLSSDSVEHLIHSLETLQGAELAPDDRAEIELWHKGKALRHLVGAYGWDVLVEMLRSYRDNAREQLARIPPGDERVIAAHAAAFAIDDFYTKFLQDIENAVNTPMPQVVREGLKRASPVPPESL